MLDEKFIEYLDEEFGRIMPEHKEKYRNMFNSLGFNDKNEDFIEFWVNYSDEIYGNIGYLVDLAMDLEDFEYSQTETLRKNLHLQNNYISFLHNELDDFLIYDKNTDEVFFIEAPNIKKFIQSKYYDKHWKTFVSFLKDFLSFKET